MNPGLSISATPAETRERSSSRQRSKNEDRKILVTNISQRVTANQLKSFFSKFGAVSFPKNDLFDFISCYPHGISAVIEYHTL